MASAKELIAELERIKHTSEEYERLKERTEKALTFPPLKGALVGESRIGSLRLYLESEDNVQNPRSLDAKQAIDFANWILEMFRVEENEA